VHLYYWDPENVIFPKYLLMKRHRFRMLDIARSIGPQDRSPSDRAGFFLIRTASSKAAVKRMRKCLFNSILTRIERVDFSKRVIFAG
jgi:hypothetical protein